MAGAQVLGQGFDVRGGVLTRVHALGLQRPGGTYEGREDGIHALSGAQESGGLKGDTVSKSRPTSPANGPVQSKAPHDYSLLQRRHRPSRKNRVVADPRLQQLPSLYRRRDRERYRGRQGRRRGWRSQALLLSRQLGSAEPGGTFRRAAYPDLSEPRTASVSVGSSSGAGCPDGISGHDAPVGRHRG